MIVVIGQNRYDTPHALWVASIIKKTKPDAVALELPKSFQKVIDKFQKGKIKEKDLDEEFGKLLGRSLSIDEKLLEKLEKKKVSTLDLSQFSPDGAFVHMILAANKAGAKAFAVDVRMREIKKKVENSLRAAEKGEIMDAAEKKAVAPSQGVLFFSELVHAPFHFLEMVLGHNPHKSPFDHPAECRICKLGIKWERFWHSVLAHTMNLIPGNQSDYLYALHKYDRMREKEMAERIAKIAEKNEKVLAVVHSWHEIPVEKELEAKGFEVRELSA